MRTKQTKETQRDPHASTEDSITISDEKAGLGQQAEGQQSPTAPPEGAGATQFIQVQGWRRRVLLIAIFIGLFLSFLDTTIVSVALPTIASEFRDYSHSTWVITAYLLTYMAFAIIITRLSDVFGTKAIEVTNFVLFIGFSLGCALSRSMTQLIVFRAFQGIGGSGLFSMTMVIGMTAVPPKNRSAIAGAVGMMMVTAGVLGPVLSGAITGNNNSSTWRWIFYLNLPIGAIALGLLLLAWPSDKSRKSFTRAAVLSIDLLGCVLLLTASILLVFALQEGGTHVYQWGSGPIIACLVVSGIAFLAFVIWQQWLIMHPAWPVKPVFPISVAGQRVMGSAMLIAFFSGFIFYIAVISLPQRFQIVDGDSPVLAGVKLLPMMVSSASGSFVAGSINARKNLTSYTLMTASVFLALGCGLMITLGDAYPTPVRQFGFQVFLGLGFGMAVTVATIIPGLNVEQKWQPVTQGALTQMRSFGGSIGLAVGVIVFNNDIRNSGPLKAQLSPSEVLALYKSPLVISQLSPKDRALVGQVYAKAFTNEMQVATYIAAACFVASILTWQRNPPQHQDQSLVVVKEEEDGIGEELGLGNEDK